MHTFCIPLFPQPNPPNPSLMHKHNATLTCLSLSLPEGHVQASVCDCQVIMGDLKGLWASGDPACLLMSWPTPLAAAQVSFSFTAEALASHSGQRKGLTARKVHRLDFFPLPASAFTLRLGMCVRPWIVPGELRCICFLCF